MKTYQVKIKATITKIETVEAENEEQAVELAHEQFSPFNDGTEERYDQEDEWVEEVEEVKVEKIPYFEISNAELDGKKPLGDKVQCPHCGQEHKVEYGERVMPDGTKVPSKTLAFYKCGEKLFLAGIDGKEI